MTQKIDHGYTNATVDVQNQIGFLEGEDQKCYPMDVDSDRPNRWFSRCISHLLECKYVKNSSERSYLADSDLFDFQRVVK